MKMDAYDWENACNDLKCGSPINNWANEIPKAYNNLGKVKFEKIANSYGVLGMVKPYVPAYAAELKAERDRRWEENMAMDRRDHYREYGHY